MALGQKDKEENWGRKTVEVRSSRWRLDAGQSDSSRTECQLDMKSQ